ncbi:MAG: hypothetical protein JXR88_02425 [Clostridia bacterium]|nr:hypothetical protein [Clostridia bacterium]
MNFNNHYKFGEPLRKETFDNLETAFQSFQEFDRYLIREIKGAKLQNNQAMEVYIDRICHILPEMKTWLSDFIIYEQTNEKLKLMKLENIENKQNFINFVYKNEASKLTGMEFMTIFLNTYQDYVNEFGVDQLKLEIRNALRKCIKY